LIHGPTRRAANSCSHSLPASPPEHLDAHWYIALKAAGIEDFHFHDLRYTTVSMLAAQGASLLEIADILGHKTLGTV
jgi:integrase